MSAEKQSRFSKREITKIKRSSEKGIDKKNNIFWTGLVVGNNEIACYCHACQMVHIFQEGLNEGVCKKESPFSCEKTFIVKTLQEVEWEFESRHW